MTDKTSSPSATLSEAIRVAGLIEGALGNGLVSEGWLSLPEAALIVKALRAYAPSEIPQSGEVTREALLKANAEQVSWIEDLQRELELCRAVTTLCCKKETTPSASRRSILREVAMNYVAADKPVFQAWLDMEIGDE